MSEANLPVASARPSLRFAGQDAADLAAALMEMRVEERSDGLARCELTFGNWGSRDGGPAYTLFDRDRIEFGKRLEIRHGDESLFAGLVMALAGHYPSGGVGEAEIRLYAEDRLQALRMTRRTRCFTQKSDADVASQIASNHGLSAQTDLPGPTHAVLAQVNQSDLAFLRERARALGGEVWLDGDTLHLATRQSRKSGSSIELVYGANLRSFDIRADLALQRTRLSVSGWDVGQKQAIKEDAAASLLDAEVGSIDGNPGEAGATILRKALGERADTVAHLAPANASEARAIAEAWLRQINRRFLCGYGTADPDARLRPGARVDLKGLGKLFNGEYTVTEVCHRFDTREGARSEFAVERPWIGRA
jgi:phage protein D